MLSVESNKLTLERGIGRKAGGLADEERVEPTAITLRRPRAADAPALQALVAACPPLDGNSRYCNLLHCTHFAGTSVAAERRVEGEAPELVGFISAYRPPERPEALFIWQVAVRNDARGRSLGRHMLRHLLTRPACAGVHYLETSVTDDNPRSEAMFRGLAEELDATVRRHLWFERDRHFSGEHANEYLFRIGPFTTGSEPVQPIPPPVAWRG